VNQVGGGNAALVAVIRSDRGTVGVVVVDDDAELVGGQAGLGKAGDDGVLGRCGVCRSLYQQNGDEAAQKLHALHARRSTHSRTSSGPR
jgi:hypothetical protein